jgi:uncharacterized protein YdaU (DUF1376 family)
MAKFPAMPLWTDAYLADCSHLSDAEHGRYMLILIHLWRMPKQRFPNETRFLSRKFNRSAEVIENEWKPLMQEFCKCDGNWISHARLSREFAYVEKQHAVQSARANKRWHKEKDVSPGNATAGIAPAYAASGNAPTPIPLAPEEGFRPSGEKPSSGAARARSARAAPDGARADRRANGKEPEREPELSAEEREERAHFLAEIAAQKRIQEAKDAEFLARKREEILARHRDEKAAGLRSETGEWIGGKH